MPEGLAHLVRDGRKEFMKQWRSLHNQSMLDVSRRPVLARRHLNDANSTIPNVRTNREIYHLHRGPDPARSEPTRFSVNGVPVQSRRRGSVIHMRFLLRYFGEEEDDRFFW